MQLKNQLRYKYREMAAPSVHLKMKTVENRAPGQFDNKLGVA
jgi:hypothetical protein